MPKCAVCVVSSWVIGLSTATFSLAGIFDLPLPVGTLAGAGYVVLILIVLGFLYYQIVPCPRCERKLKGE